MRKFILYAIMLISVFSCKNKKLSSEIIDDINSGILYYRNIYQSTLYIENDEIKEKDKTKIKTEYFDKNNNIIMELSSIYGTSYNTYEYDENGNQISQNTYNKDGELIYRNEYSFNENNKIISVIYYDKNGKYDGEANFLYDYFGNIIQKIIIDKNHKVNNSIIYAFDNKGRCNAAINSYNDNTQSVNIYSYKIDGKLYNIQSFENGIKQTMTKILEYDDKDREIKSITYVYDFNAKEIPFNMDYYEYHDN